jgi:hypothetical protein
MGWWWGVSLRDVADAISLLLYLQRKKAIAPQTLLVLVERSPVRSNDFSRIDLVVGSES